MQNLELKSELNLVDYLHPYFEHNGYEYYPVLKQFRKLTNFGFYNFLFSLSEYQDSVYVNFFLGFRINLIEIPVCKLSGGFVNSSIESNTLLLSTKKLEHSIELKQNRLLKKNNIEPACDYFIDFMDRVGFNFLDTYSKISNLHYLLNVDNNRSEIYYNNNFSRSFKGLVACAIVSPSELKTIFDNHLSYLYRLNCPDTYIENFKKLFKILSTTSLN